MLRITLLNPKGGCGKTTLATNLASYFAGLGHKTVLYDFDAQGSSTHWLETRGTQKSLIHGIPAYRDSMRQTRAWQLRLPRDTDRVIIDTPASISGPQLDDLIAKSDRILVPVLASPIDVDAFLNFAERLARYPRVRSKDVPVGVVANRVRPNTRFFKTLTTELATIDERLGLRFVTSLRETQHYVRSGQRGLGLIELKSSRIARDLDQWEPLLQWLNGYSSGIDARHNERTVPGTTAAQDGTPPRQEPLDLEGQIRNDRKFTFR